MLYKPSPFPQMHCVPPYLPPLIIFWLTFLSWWDSSPIKMQYLGNREEYDHNNLQINNLENMLYFTNQ